MIFSSECQWKDQNAQNSTSPFFCIIMKFHKRSSMAALLRRGVAAARFLVLRVRIQRGA